MFNIITTDNGVGLSTDIKIIRKYFATECNYVSFHSNKRVPAAQVGIFLEQLDPRFYPYHKINVLIPNPEWFPERWIPYLKGIDYVLCKTKDCFNIFKQLHPNCIYTGFAAFDVYQPSNWVRCFLHVAGNSMTKNTQQVIDAFSKLPYPLYVISRKEWKSGAKNIHLIHGRIDEKNLREIQNKAMFHVCPSQYEGYGHYIHEGRSCSLVMTTNSEPMNEFISDPRLLVEVRNYGRQHLGRLAFINTDSLRQKAFDLMQLPDEELNTMFLAQREQYLKDCNFFAAKCKELEAEWLS